MFFVFNYFCTCLKFYKMKKLYFLAILSCLSFSVFSQTAASYSFLAFSSTYSSISATGTSVGSIATCDDCAQTSIPIGFTFTYCGTNYTQLSACSNGYLSLANSGAGGGTYVVTTGEMAAISGGAGMLCPLWVDLIGSDPYGYGCNASHAYYQTTGVAPNRIFTFEWDNFHAYNWPGACVCCYLNMQVKLYEGTNIIDFCYGTSTLSGMGYEGCVIGIANSTTDWQTLNNNSAAPTPSSVTFYRTTITSAPANGQVYRWFNQCSGTPTAGVTHATKTNGCSAYVDTMYLTGTTTATGLTYQWQSSPDSATWTNIPGATNPTYVATVTTTIYYRCIVTCTYSSLSSTSAPAVGDHLGAPAGGILAPSVMCAGTSVTVTDPTPGGTWSSSPPGIASIGSLSGLVTAGASAGTVTITYTIGSGCFSTTTIAVVTTPSPIAGIMSVCQGMTTTLSETTGGGSWTSSNTVVATIGSATGTVYGLTPGTTTITYALGSCTATTVVTINPAPPAILGPDSVCVGSSVTWTDAVGGGTWTTSLFAAATVGYTTGVVTGNYDGTDVITYTAPGGCTTSSTITVNIAPAVYPTPTVCVDGSSAIFETPPGGTWSTSSTALATVDPVSTYIFGVSCRYCNCNLYFIRWMQCNCECRGASPARSHRGSYLLMCWQHGCADGWYERGHLDQQQPCCIYDRLFW